MLLTQYLDNNIMNTNRFNLALIAVTATVLAACTSTRSLTEPALDERYSLQINEQLDNLRNYSRIYYQDGQRVNKKLLNRSRTHCRLHVFDPNFGLDHNLSVSPGIIGIEEIRQNIYTSNATDFYTLAPGGLMKANMLFPRRDDPSIFAYRLDMQLSSIDQPEVQTLKCAKWKGIRGYFYPTMAEIQGALGDLVEIRTP